MSKYRITKFIQNPRTITLLYRLQNYYYVLNYISIKMAGFTKHECNAKLIQLYQNHEIIENDDKFGSRN